MQTRISNLIDLKKVVQQLEKDLGLGSMSSHEKALLLAISDLQQLDGVAQTKAILAHELTTSISRPSIFRTLKKLKEHGKLKRADGSNGSYQTV